MSMGGATLPYLHSFCLRICIVKLYDFGVTVLIIAIVAGLGWHFGWIVTPEIPAP
jgi:glucose uptake protein GlcU